MCCEVNRVVNYTDSSQLITATLGCHVTVRDSLPLDYFNCESASPAQCLLLSLCVSDLVLKCVFRELFKRLKVPFNECYVNSACDGGNAFVACLRGSQDSILVSAFSLSISHTHTHTESL